MHPSLIYFNRGFDFLKKFLIFTIVILAVFFLFSSFTNYAKPSLTTSGLINKNREEIYKVIKDKDLNASKQGKATISFYRFVVCGLSGEGCTNNPRDGDKNFNNSLFGMVTGLIITPYVNPPASGVYWVYSGLKDAGFVPKSYAAEGVGFAAIQPLSNLWKVFRDVAYLLLVMVLIVIGFMIMFRIKINPQTIVTLENSLPRIILSLILITFSFAIAGFLIDLMYVVLAVGINILSRNSVVHIDAATVTQNFLAGNPGRLFDEIFFHDNFWTIGQALFNVLPAALNITLRVILGGLALFIAYKDIPFISAILGGHILDNIVELGGTVGTILQGVFALILIPLVAILSPYLLSLIVMITGLFVFFRILFLLLKSYVFTLLLIIFSPLMLLFVAIPGRNAFSSWLKNMVANLLVFPAVAILLLIALIITSIPAAAGGFWRPPFLYSMSPTSISVVIGVVILFMIPELVKKMKELLGIKDTGLAFGVGALFGGVTGGAKGAFGALTQFGSARFGVEAIQRLGGTLRGRFRRGGGGSEGVGGAYGME